MRILDVYIGKIILHYTGLVLAVLYGLFTFVTFIDQLGDLGNGHYGLLQVIRFVVLSSPRTIYELFPMAALLGTILGLSSMANDSELIVIRASGISTLQIVGSVLKVGAIFVTITILIGELLTPTSETMAQRGRAQALQENIKQQTNFGLWMRDRKNYVNVGEVLPDLTVLRIRLFEFDDAGHLRSLVYADRGSYDNKRWRMEDIKQTLIDSDRSQSKTAVAAYWKTAVTPDILQVFLIKSDQLSTWQLRQYINHLEDNSQDTGPYELAFWNKLMLPLSTGVMVVLAIPFVFRQVRSGALGKSLLVGIMLGLVFYVVSRGLGYVVLVYHIPPLVGAVMPVAVFLALALVMLRRAG